LNSRRWDVEPEEPTVGVGCNGERKKKMPLTRRTMETGFLYSATFLLVYLPSILTATITFDTGSGMYSFLLIAVATLSPLQGFFNMIIFTSPDWLAWLKKKKPFASCCRMILPQRSSRPDSQLRSGATERAANEEDEVAQPDDLDLSMDFFFVRSALITVPPPPTPGPKGRSVDFALPPPKKKIGEMSSILKRI
jgi:hypothetical protein